VEQGVIMDVAREAMMTVLYLAMPLLGISLVSIGFGNQRVSSYHVDSRTDADIHSQTLCHPRIACRVWGLDGESFHGIHDKFIRAGFGNSQVIVFTTDSASGIAPKVDCREHYRGATRRAGATRP